MKGIKLLLLAMLISVSAFSQTTPWTATPPVSWQTRTYSGEKQIRALFGTSLISFMDSLAKYNYVFSNGLTKTGLTVKLGGVLNQNTSIDINGNTFTMYGLVSGLPTASLQLTNQGVDIGSVTTGDEQFLLRTNAFTKEALLSRQIGQLEQAFRASNSSGLTIKDEIDSLGASYVADYFPSLPFNNRRIPDVGAVKKLVDSAGVASAVTAGNGLSKSGSQIKLGGSPLTENVEIDNNGHNVFWYDSTADHAQFLFSPLFTFNVGVGTGATGYSTLDVSNSGTSLSYTPATGTANTRALDMSDNAIKITDGNGKGLEGNTYFGAMADSNTYVQKRYVDSISTNTDSFIKNQTTSLQPANFNINGHAAIGNDTAGIDPNVKLFKIGGNAPTDFNSIAALSYTQSINNATEDNNGWNIELKGVGAMNASGRVVRAIKSVALVDPNGYTLSNAGGAGIGIEAVARLQGLGTATVMTGLYARVLQDTNDPLSILSNANGIVVNTPGGFNTNPIGKASGVTIVEQGYLGRSTQSYNMVLGTNNQSGLLPTGALANYSIYNLSSNPNYFNGGLGIGLDNPLAKLHIQSTTLQQRLGYNGSNYVDHTVASNGNYTIAPTGTLTTLTSSLNVGTGVLRSVTPASGTFTAQLGATSNTAMAGVQAEFENANVPRATLYQSATDWGLAHAAGTTRLPFNIYSGTNNQFSISTGGVVTIPNLTTAGSVQTSAAGVISSIANTGTGNNVLATNAAITSPTITNIRPASTFQTGAGTAGTDSLVVKNSGTLKAVSAGYYAPATSVSPIRTSAASAASTLTVAYTTDYSFSGTIATWTLPAISSTLKGGSYQITIKNRGTGVLTINSSAGGNDIYTTVAINTYALNPGAAITLINDGTYITLQ